MTRASPHSQSHCLRGSPSPSIPLCSFIHAPAGLRSPTPSTDLHAAPPPHSSSTPFHLYSILRAAHLSFVVPCRPLFNLIVSLAPLSCSSLIETMLLRGCRGTPTRGYDDDNPVSKAARQHMAQREDGRAGERAVLIDLAQSLTKWSCCKLNFRKSF